MAYPADMFPQGRRILIVEDEDLLASLLSETLIAHGFDVETAPGVAEARKAVQDFDPDAVLLDISLGEGPSGVDLAYALHQQHPEIAIIFLTKHPTAKAAGLSSADLPPDCGFLRKDLVRDTGYLLACIDAVMTNRATDVRHDREAIELVEGLDAKQLEILRLIAIGYTNDQIGKLKGASQTSVERWCQDVFRALGIDTKGPVNPRVEAARRYIAAAGIPDRP
jgi:DNA-binding NarL/FixJ family response regulator